MPYGERSRLIRLRAENYRLRQEANREKARDKLTDEDRALAETMRLPSDREQRVALAKRLKDGTGRQRSFSEVAAIMGMSANAIKTFLMDPAVYKAQRDRAEVNRKKRKPRDETSELKAIKPKPKPTLPRETTGQWVRRMRKAMSLTQRALADEVGVARSSVQDWEADRTTPLPSSLARLHEIFSR